MKHTLVLKTIACGSFVVAILPWVAFGIVYAGPVPAVFTMVAFFVAWPFAALTALAILISLYGVKGCVTAKVFAALTLLTILVNLFVVIHAGLEKQRHA